jgi:hypothetical protein
MDITNFVLSPLTLIFLVMALVQFVKDLGMTGNKLRFVSLVIGFALAGVFKAREFYPTYALWIDYAFFSLAVGLGACGAYSLIDERIPKKA